jgi:DNA-binding NarL/FixJ family response regulator
VTQRQSRILVVDDDARFVHFLATLLESAGFEVLAATSADSAVAGAREARPDAALVDVVMPGRGGYSICRELREEIDPDLRVIFVSGERADAMDRAAGISEREIEILQLIAEGWPPAEVAQRLFIARKTVSSHVERIFAKLGVHTRAQAVAIAYEAGLIRVEPWNRVGGGDEVEAHLLDADFDDADLDAA